MHCKNCFEYQHQKQICYVINNKTNKLCIKFYNFFQFCFKNRVITEKENEYQIKVTGEEQANKLLARLLTEGITIITFDLREPSLHEIIVEKVGEFHEE